MIKINRKNPLTRGLVYCDLPGVGDVISRNKMSLDGGAFVAPGGQGIAYVSTDDAVSGHGINTPLSESVYAITNQYSIALLTQIDVLSAWGSLFCIQFDGSWGDPWGSIYLYQDTGTTQLRHLCGVGVGQRPIIDSDNGYLSADSTPHMLHVTRDGTTVRFYKDGVQDGNDKTTTTASPTWDSTRRPASIMSTDDAQSGVGIEGKTFIAAMWNRELSAGEVHSFNKNPWQVFAPQRILIPMTAAAAVEEEEAGLITSSGMPLAFLPTSAGLAYRTSIKITDVNTTESWIDGAEDLPITGTGFI